MDATRIKFVQSFSIFYFRIAVLILTKIINLFRFCLTINKIGFKNGTINQSNKNISFI